MDKVLKAIFLFVGVIVGAGVLGMPKAMASAGVLTSTILLLLGGAALYLGALMIMDMSLQFKEKKHLPDIIQHYFPWGGNALVLLTLFVVMYAALTAYLIGSGEQIKALVSLDNSWGSMIFYVLSVIPVILGLGVTASASIAIGIIMLLTIIAISLLALGLFNPSQITWVSTDVGSLTAFFSVALFALFGHNIIPEITWICDRDKKLIQKVLLLGLAIPLLTYLFFSVVVDGALGSKVTEVGTVALSQLMGSVVSWFISLFALSALYTSFIGISISLRDSYEFDFGLPHWVALVLAVIPPLLLYWFDPGHSFLGWIGDIGGRMLNLFMILVALAYMLGVNAKKVKPSIPFPIVASIFVIVMYATNFLLSFL